MPMALAIALGGAVGALSRHYMAAAVSRAFGLGFPYGTLTVNVVGCFLMGLLVEAMALRFSITPEARGFLTVGLLGGFTTFSAFSLEVALLYERGQLLLAALYVVASVVLSVAALFGGLAVGRWAA